MTIIVSLTVAYRVNGSFLGSVRIVDLRSYGGTTFEDLRNLELWRIPLAQMLHVKMPHMLFNALCLFLLGSLLENAIGRLRLILLWGVAGGVATAISPALVEAPWNIGTGASQAVFAFAGCAVVLAVAHAINRKWTVGLVAFSVVPGLLLDVLSAAYSKPGHVVGFILGAAFGIVFLKLQLPPGKLAVNDS
jgi:membrane associated rhomboid family serine protease